ncbi:MAG: alpha-L-fucosidase [Cytophagales bacterium]|nr:alpha-L-fucosidase [Cytophagales bacterium]
MKPFVLIVLCLGLANVGFSQEKYKADWKELNKRPVPAWFTDAKFGIFIHWGPYSVPAWSPKGTYSEWYQHQLEHIPESREHHNRVYGENFSYYKFGEMFTADLYDAKGWAELFKKSGAKYVVPTSKHHDGYCLWPGKEANYISDAGDPLQYRRYAQHRCEQQIIHRLSEVPGGECDLYDQ